MLPIHLTEVADTDPLKLNYNQCCNCIIYVIVKPEYTSRIDCSVINNQVLRKIKIAVESDIKNCVYINLR